MKYILPVFLLLFAGIASAQTPKIYDTWSPVILGSMMHVTITEHELIVEYPGEGIARELPELMALPSPSLSEDPDLPIDPIPVNKREKEKADTMQLLKIVYDSAHAKGRMFLSPRKDSKFILPFKFLIKDNGELEAGIADGFMSVVTKNNMSLKQVEKATRNPGKNAKIPYRHSPCDPELSLFGGISFTFYNSNRTAEFGKLKNPATMPKEEMIGMITSFGNRISALLQSTPFDSSGNPIQGYAVFGPMLNVAHDLFTIHGYNPLGMAELFDKMKDDSDIKAVIEETGNRVEESVPALREAKARREANRAAYSTDTTITAEVHIDTLTKEAPLSKDEFVEATKEPEATENIQALVQYPEKARRNSIEGSVTFSALIAKDGTVQKVTIDKSDNEIFNQAVIDAVEKTWFKPAMNVDQPVRVWYTQKVNFRLH